MRIRHLPYIKPGFLYLPKIYQFRPTEFLVVFDEKSKYSVKDKVEQEDYFKACGVSFSPILHSRVNSIMLGYNYNIGENTWDVVAYWHDKTGRAQRTKEVTVRAYDHVKLQIFENKAVLVTPDHPPIDIIYSLNQIEASDKVRTILPWAGGTKASRNCFSYHLTQRFIPDYENKNIE